LCRAGPEIQEGRRNEFAKSAGDMYPETFYAHLIAMLEIMVGMFGLAVVTGLIFVRFSRPTGRMHFRIDETEDLALI
jgi:hypothetical protein